MDQTQIRAELAEIRQILRRSGELSEQRATALHHMGNLMDLGWTMTNDLPVFFVAIDRQGRTIQINDNMLDTLDYTAEETLHRDYLETFVPPDEHQQVKRVFARLLEQTGPTISENSVLDRHGRRHLVEWHGRQVFDDEGRLECFFGLGIDITARRRAENDKRRIQSQLLQAQKMEAIARLAGGIAHDFNNLITAILGISELALMRVEDPVLARQDLEKIQLAGVKAAQLTRQLLLLGYKQPAGDSRSIICVNDTIRDLVQLLDRLIGEDISIKMSLAEECAPILADGGAFTQMFLNLAVNARDAMPSGGTLEISTNNVTCTRQDCGGKPEVSPGEYVHISVLDTGTGIDPSIQDRVFEPFFTTKDPSNGTGLGLSVVYGIVRQHGGWIQLDSVPGQGASFDIYLPACERSHQEGRRNSIEHDLRTGGGEVVLLLEDDDIVLEFTRRALSENGYQVLTATSCKQALDLHRGNDKVRLLFSDVVLPDGSGSRLANQLMASSPHLRVILSSGYSDDRINPADRNNPAFSFLPKPYSLSDLLESVWASLHPS